MNYIELTIAPQPYSEEIADVLAALLAPIGFDSFEQHESTLLAYCPTSLYDEEAVRAMLAELPLPGVTCSYTAREIEAQDWNATWEQEAFQPIVIEDQCVIHAPRATDIPACSYDICLTPKMSFGSGHHETTAQMLTRILALDQSGKAVLDMGCGTGVLGILAAMRGAAQVDAIDIDDWACNNAREHAALNDVTLNVLCGDATLLETSAQKYDLILANINRNILLHDMSTYVAHLAGGGDLLMSGFYEEDLSAIRSCAEALGLTFVDATSRNRWVCVRFTRSC
jgi:ribosomal protein L11 methyltransferase